MIKSNGATMFMVDLAGAEDQADTGSTGATLKQASAINKSLSELTNVMNSLCHKQEFINYRNSKLTFLLKKALGGNSKTSFMLTCNPVAKQLQMNLRTLQFGNRARSLMNDAKLVASSSSSDLNDWQAKYEEAMAKMEEQTKTIASLQSQLLEMSTDNKSEEKKNLDANYPTTTRIQRRPSIMASVLEEHEKAHLEDLLERDHPSQPKVDSSDSDSESSCPALILTGAALQRLTRPSVMNPTPPPPTPPEEEEEEKVAVAAAAASVTEPPREVVEADATNIILQRDYDALSDEYHELELRIFELEEASKKKGKIHYPTSLWGKIGFYVCIVVILIGICMILYAYKTSKGYFFMGMAWTIMLIGISFFICCLYF
jgi:hypothetical protein